MKFTHLVSSRTQAREVGYFIIIIYHYILAGFRKVKPKVAKGISAMMD